LEHVLDPEIFDSDEGVALNLLPSRLVGVVLTLAGDLEMLLGRFAAAVGTLLPSGALALRSPQSLGAPLRFEQRCHKGLPSGWKFREHPRSSSTTPIF
jgi:hypothetical protein